MAEETKKKMQILTFPSGTMDNCPQTKKHNTFKRKARDAEDGRSGCPSCKTVWAVREVEELTDLEVQLTEEREAIEATAANSGDPAFDGNAGLTIGGGGTGITTTVTEGED